MSKSPKISNIIVVDDHALVREGLVHLLELRPDLTVCAQAKNTAEALSATEANSPDLVIVDLNLGGEDGLELVKSLKARWPDLPTLVISVRDETLYAERSLHAGATGYVMKTAPSTEIMEAIESALSGELYVSRKENARLLNRLVQSKHEEDDTVKMLTDRELHIFQLIGAGQSPREIATTLGISVRTAESHRDNIKTKLGLDNALAVTHYASKWIERDAL